MNAVIASDTYARDLIETFERNATEAFVSTLKGRSRVAISSRSVAGIGGGLILAFGLIDKANAQAAGGGGGRPAGPPAPPFAPSAYVRIAPDGKVTLYSKNPEIGQGIKTAFGLILAEELDAKWSDVTVEQAPINAAVYGTQFAGGSLSIPMNWDVLRQAGAGARSMLIAAAAQEWNVPASECTASEGVITHAASNRSFGYGQVADKAASMPLPDPKQLKLKGKGEYKLLGRRHTQVDNIHIVQGHPLYGVDVQVPNMKVAAFQKCPAVGGKVASANLDEIKKLPGVVDAFIVTGTGKPTEVMPGVAIIANNTWAAFSAKKKLKVVWDESAASKDSWKQISAKAKDLSKQPVGALPVGRTVGDVETAMKGGKTVESFYTFNFVSHRRSSRRTAPPGTRRMRPAIARDLGADADSGRRPYARRAGLRHRSRKVDTAPDARRRRLRPSAHERQRRRGGVHLEAGRRHSREADVHARGRHGVRLLPAGRLPCVQGERRCERQAGRVELAHDHLHR